MILRPLAPRVLEHLVLRGEEVLRLPARDEDPAGQGQAERVQAGHVQSGDAGGAADELHEQVAVLGGDESRAEHHVRARLAGDVGDVPPVADDLQPFPARVLDALRFALQAERLGLEEAVHVRGADRVPERRQSVVEGELVARVRAAVGALARREDVECRRREVRRLLRARGGGYERRHEERNHRDGDEERTQLHRKGASLQLAGRCKHCDPWDVSRLGMFAAAGVLAVTGSGSATVSYVVDGDTIALRDGPHVRLVQIDTPEVGTGECYSRRAAKDLRRLAPAGARVGLEADPNLDSVDRYGRLLRYVFHRGINVNLRLVEQGDATVWFYDGDRGRYASRLLAAARRARAEKRGLWGACNAVWNPYGPATTTARARRPAPRAASATRLTRPSASRLRRPTWTARTSRTSTSRCCHRIRTTSTATTTGSAARANTSLAFRPEPVATIDR